MKKRFYTSLVKYLTSSIKWVIRFVVDWLATIPIRRKIKFINHFAWILFSVVTLLFYAGFMEGLVLGLSKQLHIPAYVPYIILFGAAAFYVIEFGIEYVSVNHLSFLRFGEECPKWVSNIPIIGAKLSFLILLYSIGNSPLNSFLGQVMPPSPTQDFITTLLVTILLAFFLFATSLVIIIKARKELNKGILSIVFLRVFSGKSI